MDVWMSGRPTISPSSAPLIFIHPSSHPIIHPSTHPVFIIARLKTIQTPSKKIAKMIAAEERKLAKIIALFDSK